MNKNKVDFDVLDIEDFITFEIKGRIAPENKNILDDFLSKMTDLSNG